jgi:hypothetical protein
MCMLLVQFTLTQYMEILYLFGFPVGVLEDVNKLRARVHGVSSVHFHTIYGVKISGFPV